MTAGASASSTRRSSDKVAKVVVGNDLAIATSGAYARGDHVLDPHTRRPPRASSRSPSPAPSSPPPTRTPPQPLRWGDGPAWTARLRGYEAMTILADGRVLSTPDFPDEALIIAEPAPATSADARHGGTDGNDRLTGSAGATLLLLLAAEGLTVLSLGSLLSCTSSSASC